MASHGFLEEFPPLDHHVSMEQKVIIAKLERNVSETSVPSYLHDSRKGLLLAYHFFWKLEIPTAEISVMKMKENDPLAVKAINGLICVEF